jgi:mRNA interferase RelE/StbE
VIAPGEYELIVTAPAATALSNLLPESVTPAVIEFLTTSLVHEPLRVGKPLREEPTGIWAARRGTYRVLYRVRDEPREDIVLGIEHRCDVYRPRSAKPGASPSRSP